MCISLHFDSMSLCHKILRNLAGFQISSFVLAGVKLQSLPNCKCQINFLHFIMRKLALFVWHLPFCSRSTGCFSLPVFKILAKNKPTGLFPVHVGIGVQTHTAHTHTLVQQMASCASLNTNTRHGASYAIIRYGLRVTPQLCLFCSTGF